MIWVLDRFILRVVLLFQSGRFLLLKQKTGRKDKYNGRPLSAYESEVLMWVKSLEILNPYEALFGR